ncbi:uncharacterized protein LOC110453202 [Mizuhopecten yessoensis]|uniref:uncharacterized protein LOC110453202 n=1 Tax=Mizuhopecten yessoensis TaxID=6573 RepID=UPI000B458FEE|nr:uncharacterized protein LOC110453202 [Mizuhopecten yessoensis]
MADRRGRPNTRLTSQNDVNNPVNWSKTEIQRKLQKLGIVVPTSISKPELIKIYQMNKNVVRPAEHTTITTKTESVPKVKKLTGQKGQHYFSGADGARGTPEQSEHTVVGPRGIEACSSSSSMDRIKTAGTLQRRRTGTRGSTVLATSTIPTPYLYNRMQPAVKTARYTDSNAKDSPTVKIPEKNYTAIIGEQVKLECSISETPSITTVSWHRILPEGRTVKLDIDEIKYAGSNPNDPHLVIDDIKKDDEGDYVCTVSNVYGKRQSAPTSKLKVKGGPPTLNMNLTENHKTEGEAAVLKCYIYAKPQASAITWSKDEEGSGREIAIDNIKYFGGTVDSPALVIERTEKLNDEGKYICEADNIAGSGSNSVLLTINSKTANTVTIADATTLNQDISEAQQEKIKTCHSEMVIKLAENIFPAAECWPAFKQSMSTYLNRVDLENENLYKYVDKLLVMEHIHLGQYDRLYDVVHKIHKQASHIIKNAESEIQKIKKGGRQKETAVQVECKLEGDFEKDKKIPERCTSQVKEQCPEMKDRITGLGGSGCIYLKFTISEAKTPHQLSALHLAVTLKTRLENGQIVLKDEADVSLVFKTSPRVMIPTENPTDMPTLRLSRGHYNFTEGKVAILKCVVVVTEETESIQWIRVKDGKCHAIRNDNEKYFGGSPKSPSLAIADVKKSDRGIYLCRARNRADEVESDFAFVEINCIDACSIRKEILSAVNEEESSIGRKDNSDMRDDGITMEEEIKSMKEDIRTMKQDIATIRQIVSAVKTESTTDHDTDTSSKDVVSPMEVDVSRVKKEFGFDLDTRPGIREETCRFLAQKYKLKDDCVVQVRDASNQKELIIIYDPSCNSERKLKEFGHDVIIRNPKDVSTECALLSSICKNNQYSIRREEKQKLKLALNHANSLFASHSNLNIITTSPVKSKNKGADIIECPCIILVCSSKGYIPKGESKFPEELICENTSFVVDVREGYFQFGPASYSTFNSSLFHQNIKMGCSFGIEGTHNAGTVGPFVDFQGHQLFLTCAHIVNGVDPNGYDLKNIQNMFVEQPDAMTFQNPQTAGSVTRRCGEVRRAVLSPNSNRCSIDAAVVEITEQSRKPSRGEFAIDSEMNFKKAGFDDLPRFESGDIHDDPDTLDNDLRIVKFGASTHASRGIISSYGISSRLLTTDLGLQGQPNMCVMKNQMELLGLQGQPQPIFLPGDSGSGVFVVNKLPTGEQTLTCIGLAIGCTSYGSAIVTPIAAVLDALGLPRKLKQFP